jgi:tartrate dehydrogenase/decarboxylase/D-malate dehydrogenase
MTKHDPERATPYRIAVIAGDGVGKEVIPAGIEVIEAATRGTSSIIWDRFDWGTDRFHRDGAMMPPDGIDQLRGYDAIYLGAVGDPSLPDHTTLWGLLLPIRKAFDQYINLRPVRLLPGISGPLRDKGPEAIDFLCVRENTEGEYAGVGGRVHRGTAHEVAIETAVFSRFNVERTIRYAFDLARGRRRHLTSVTKSNAQQYSMTFWDDVFNDVKRDYTDVETASLLVDAAAALMIRAPERFDVVVASNLFADILTDLGGALMGSLGLAPSANLDPDRRFPSMFEPVHGSAPDIAGRGIANPIGTIWAGALMLEHLGLPKAAGRIMSAIETTTGGGSTLSPDLGGRAGTKDVAQAIVALLNQ